MLDEEMDHIIREAAENHHPPYNDKAWEKMELKLDKHLPQKKDRRKFIFFLLFFLLLGGSIVFTVDHFTGNINPLTEKIAENKITDKPGGESVLAKTETGQTGKTENINRAASEETNPDSGKKTNPIFTTGSPQDKNDRNNNTQNPDNNKKMPVTGKGKANIKVVAANPFEESLVPESISREKKPITGKTSNKMNVAITNAVAEGNESESIASNSTGIKNMENVKPGDDIKKETAKETIKTTADKKEKELVLTEEKPLSKPGKKKTRQPVAGNFGLTFSVGPDLSFVALNNPGKITLTYGAGISYNFAKRITVRTGFYLTKKIYDAAPDQYHAVIYPNLTSINADCKVYEIPVSLSYSFWQRKNHNWFGNAALSSFIMKTEDYNYNYKTPAGQTYSYYKEISNENKHYFAILSLSAGYNYRLSNRVSVQAEPYLKLPLSGIGLGKVKLNSSGILFTLTVKPFAKAH